MLRITEGSRTHTTATLKLEGRLAGECVALLEQECRRHLAAGCLVRLDCADLSSSARSGIAMLRDLPRARLQLLSPEPFIEELLREEESS